MKLPDETSLVLVLMRTLWAVGYRAGIRDSEVTVRSLVPLRKQHSPADIERLAERVKALGEAAI